MNKRAEARMALMERICDASKLLTPEERAALETWEREHVTGDGKFGSTDWPGWEPVIARLLH